MLVKKEEVIDRIRKMAGDEPSDEYISLLEDIADSWGATEGETPAEVEKRWRKKYIERFGQGKTLEEEEEEEEEEEVEEKTKFEDLFKGEK